MTSIYLTLCGALLALACPLVAQGADDGALPPARYDSLTGLYVMEDGSPYVVFNLVDQVRSPQLAGLDPASGAVRTLYPVDSLASALDFTAGAAWFVREPPSYSISFERGDGRVAGIRRVSGEDVLRGRRVHFRERDVVFRNGDVLLAGTLVLPDGVGPHPVVVMVHGSGPLTRRVPRYMAHLFAYRGIGALVYDKRGTGASEGTWQAASHETLAGDVRAAVDLLLQQPDVDTARIGLFGSSEGGYVAPVVAATHPAVSLLVCRVCPALPQHLVAPVDQRSELQRLGFTGDTLEEAVAFHLRVLAYVVHDTGHVALQRELERLREQRWMHRYGWERVPPPDAPYWRALRGVMLLDPREYYRRLTIPVLVVLGERDERIDAAQHRAAFARAASPASPEIRIEVMPLASHGMMEERYTPSGERLPFDRFVPSFHDLVVDWVALHFASPR